MINLPAVQVLLNGPPPFIERASWYYSNSARRYSQWTKPGRPVRVAPSLSIAVTEVSGPRPRLTGKYTRADEQGQLEKIIMHIS